MPFKYAFVIPILCGVCFFTTFVITYVIAVYKKDVSPVFPYISDTGTWSPESCFFGLMLNVGAIIQAVIAYIRYRHVNHVLTKETNLPQSLKGKNKFSLYLGLIAALGVSVVGNFQETNVLAAHIVGAFAAFGLGSVYLCIQTLLSYKIFPIIGKKWVNNLRLFLCITTCVSLCASGIFGAISILQFRGEDITKWTEDDGGYVFHFVSAVAEWVLASSVILFLVSFTEEFKQVSLSEPPISESA